jgi:hypothetical protein
MVAKLSSVRIITAAFLEKDLVDGSSPQQDNLHKFPVLAQKSLPARLLFLVLQLIRAILLQALLRLGCVQPLGRIDLESGGDFRWRKRLQFDI